MYNIKDFYHEYGGHNGEYFRRNIMVKLSDENYKETVNNFSKSCSNTDVYKCIYAYENTDIYHCKLYAPFYLDFDGDIVNEFDEIKHDVLKAIDYLKKLGLKEDEVQIYFSGCKGFHLLVDPRILGIYPSTNLNELFHAWACYLYNSHNIKSLDLGIYDRRRLFRINGTVNSKTGLYKIYLPMHFFKTCTAEQLFRRASSPAARRRKPNDKHSINPVAARNFESKSQNFYKKPGTKKKKAVQLPTEKQELLPCVKVLLEKGVAKGSRNNTLAALASAVLQSGYLLDETIDLMQSWNENNEPPMSYSEVEHTVRSAYTMLLDGRHYGCNSLREMGVCVASCKLFGGKENNG